VLGIELVEVNTVWTLLDWRHPWGIVKPEPQTAKPLEKPAKLPPRIAHLFKMTKVILRRDDSQFKLKADEFAIR
jgi:hypothetical protein